MHARLEFPRVLNKFRTRQSIVKVLKDSILYKWIIYAHISWLPALKSHNIHRDHLRFYNCGSSEKKLIEKLTKFGILSWNVNRKSIAQI